MFARVTNGIVRPGKMDELIELVDDSVAPEARRRAGSRGMFLLTHAGTRRAIAVTLWESEEAMLSGETDGYLGSQLAKVEALLEEAAPSTHNFRVSGSW